MSLPPSLPISYPNPLPMSYPPRLPLLTAAPSLLDRRACLIDRRTSPPDPPHPQVRGLDAAKALLALLPGCIALLYCHALP